MHRPLANLGLATEFGHALHRQNVQHLPDEFVRGVRANGAARYVCGLDQQQFGLRHFSLQGEPAVSLASLCSSINRAGESVRFFVVPVSKLSFFACSESFRTVPNFS